jgi:hypothetical protein
MKERRLGAEDLAQRRELLFQRRAPRLQRHDGVIRRAAFVRHYASPLTIL